LYTLIIIVLKFNGGPYNHEHQESISEFDGYYIINISGVIQGEDEALENKNAYAKNGLDDAISGLANKNIRDKNKYRDKLNF
jgi:hypothetical protein